MKFYSERVISIYKKFLVSQNETIFIVAKRVAHRRPVLFFFHFKNKVKALANEDTLL